MNMIDSRMGTLSGAHRAAAARDAGNERDRAKASAQIQRRMLAMITICAAQPTVKASVRVNGMPAV